MKITIKNGSNYRPSQGEFSTSTLVTLTPSKELKQLKSNIVFLVDSSSSMGGSKWLMVKETLKGLLSSFHKEDYVGLILFGSKAKEIFPLSSLGQSRRAIEDTLEKLENPQGVTNLEEGLKQAFRAFKTLEHSSSHSNAEARINHVILLTDGYPTDHQGFKNTNFDAYEELVKNESSVTLTGVGIGSAEDYDASFISRLSELGKGSYYHAGDVEKFKANMKSEVDKIQNLVVSEAILRINPLQGTISRIAKVTPELLIYDLLKTDRAFSLPLGALSKGENVFLIQTVSHVKNELSTGSNIELFSIQAEYDGKTSSEEKVTLEISQEENKLFALDGDVVRALQLLQVHLNGEQIELSLSQGNKEKATRLIQNTTQLSKALGQTNVTKVLTQLHKKIEKNGGDLASSSNDLALIKDESKKTKLLM